MAKFSSLFGQAGVIDSLQRALASDTLAGSYLLVGTAGVGKGTLARAFAQAAACLKPHSDPFDSCGECESCRRVELGTQPEIVTIQPAGEQMQIWQFWDRPGKSAPGILSRTLSYAPSIGRRQIYILEKADTLTESAANSLLKVLEEPPPYVIFILLAPHSARMLPTIVSRSQMIRVSAIPTDELSSQLVRWLGMDAEKAEMYALYSEGRIGQAMQLARNPAVGEEIARILDVAEALPVALPVRALRLAEQMRALAAQTRALLGEESASPRPPNAGLATVMGEVDSAAGGEEGESAATTKERAGRRQLAAVFDMLVAFYRDLMALSVGSAHIINRDRAVKLAILAKYGTPERWMRCLDAVLLARRRLDANANITLVTEILAMKLVNG